VSEAGRRAQERALAVAERLQRQGPQQTSPTTPAPGSPAGDEYVARVLRAGRVPEPYADGVWDRVRNPAVREWTLGMDARLGGSPTPNFKLLGVGMLIVGPIGTGKSTAAALCCSEAARLRYRPVWSYVPDLADALHGNPTDRADLIRQQVAADLLVFDDFGVRDLADWEIGFLDQIVEGRYRRRRPMIVTSNWTPADLVKDERIARLADRWRERVAANVVVLAGESMRGSK
jgi:hypothetical protein